MLPTQTRLEGTESAALALGRVHYTHDAMIDLIIAQPGVSQGDLAKHFGYTQAWVSRIINSDAFLARLAVRKTEIVDPQLVLSVDEKLRAVASKSLDVVLEKLNAAPSLDQALAAVNTASKALGYGARPQHLNLQQNFVVALPQKAENAASWAQKYAGPSPQLQAMAEAVEEAKVVSDGN